jgi:hypothetical protein
LVIDLESLVGDSQTVINITRNGKGECIIGLGGKAGYVADIEIPQREYEYTTVEEELSPESSDGEEAEKKLETKRAPLPLDLSAVVLKLWPLPETEKRSVA